MTNRPRDRGTASEFDRNLLIHGLPYEINSRLRFSTSPDLGLNEYSTRADVRRVRDHIPAVRGIHLGALKEIDKWLDETG